MLKTISDQVSPSLDTGVPHATVHGNAAMAKHELDRVRGEASVASGQVDASQPGAWQVQRMGCSACMMMSCWRTMGHPCS